MVLFSVGLSWSENPYPWSNPQVAATFAIGVVLTFCLAIYETWVKKDGMFHHDLFTNRNFTIAIICVFCEGVAFFAANNYFAFEVSVFFETDNLLVVTRYAVMLITASVAALVTGYYSARTKSVRWATVTAFCLFTIFFICMASTTRDMNNPVWGYTVLLGAPLGICLTTLVVVAQLSTPRDQIAIASGLIISIRSVGGTVGLAIYNAVFIAQMNHLGENIANAVIPAGLSPDNLGAFIGALTTQNQTALGTIPGVTGEIIGKGADALLDTYLLAFRYVWISAACFVAIAAVVAAFLFDPRKEFNMHIDAPLEKEDGSSSALETTA